jgi:hypothetical protein
MAEFIVVWSWIIVLSFPEELGVAQANLNVGVADSEYERWR